MPIDLFYVRWLESRLVASVWSERGDQLMQSVVLAQRKTGLRFKAMGVVVLDRVLCNELDRLEANT